VAGLKWVRIPFRSRASRGVSSDEGPRTSVACPNTRRAQGQRERRSAHRARGKASDNLVPALRPSRRRPTCRPRCPVPDRCTGLAFVQDDRLVVHDAVAVQHVRTGRLRRCAGADPRGRSIGACTRPAKSCRPRPSHRAHAAPPRERALEIGHAFVGPARSPGRLQRPQRCRDYLHHLVEVHAFMRFALAKRHIEMFGPRG
jgi:hypothetical protein